MWYCFHASDTWNHVSHSNDLQIGHAIEGWDFLLLKSCLRAYFMYGLVQNFIKHVSCEHVSTWHFHNSLDSSLSMSLLRIH